MSFVVSLHDDAKNQLEKLDKSIKDRLIKLLARMREETPGRHLHHGMGFFVREAGQYRIVYRILGAEKKIYFVGDHKDYEKWYSGRK